LGFHAYHHFIDDKFWDNYIIARPSKVEDGKYEICFGHHRLQALRELDGDSEVEITVEEINDNLMVERMIRENMAGWQQNIKVVIESIKIAYYHLKGVIKQWSDKHDPNFEKFYKMLPEGRQEHTFTLMQNSGAPTADFLHRFTGTSMPKRIVQSLIKGIRREEEGFDIKTLSRLPTMSHIEYFINAVDSLNVPSGVLEDLISYLIREKVPTMEYSSFRDIILLQYVETIRDKESTDHDISQTQDMTQVVEDEQAIVEQDEDTEEEDKSEGEEVSEEVIETSEEQVTEQEAEAERREEEVVEIFLCPVCNTSRVAQENIICGGCACINCKRNPKGADSPYCASCICIDCKSQPIVDFREKLCTSCSRRQHTHKIIDKDLESITNAIDKCKTRIGRHRDIIEKLPSGSLMYFTHRLTLLHTSNRQLYSEISELMENVGLVREEGR